MAAFCHFWRMAPDQFWRLTVAEYSSMVTYMNDLADRSENG